VRWSSPSAAAQSHAALGLASDLWGNRVEIAGYDNIRIH
jgi:hypothetical protein